MVVGVVGLAAVLGGLSGSAMVGSAGEPGAAAASAAADSTLAAAASAEAPAASSTSSRSGRSLAERAAAGDPAALQTLKARSLSERTAAETLALARGRDAAKLNELAELEAKLQGQPGLSTSPPVTRQLLAFVRDPRTTTAALRTVARIRGPSGPDLLFYIWTSTSRRTQTTWLAQQLLFCKDVRPHASAALSIVLDLRDNQDCSKVRRILRSAIEHADRRALVALARLKRQSGCGPRQRQDCYACLRDGRDLQRAIDAATRRPRPSFD
jgi:hypothetical protein